MVEQDGDMTPQIVVMSIKSLVELITFIVLPAIYRATTLVMGIGTFVLTNGLPVNYLVKTFDQTNTDKCNF